MDYVLEVLWSLFEQVSEQLAHQVCYATIVSQGSDS
jgi:hypothetical protein